MATTALESEYTHFTRDISGRWVCNTLAEALLSTDQTIRPDAKAFDVIIIGGGSFGGALAQHIFYKDVTAKKHRILVLEAGPFALHEHVQNVGLLGLNPPGPTRISDLRSIGQDGKPRAEVWGLAWHSPIQFPGLAYCVGGRSVFFGGWSPRLLDAEMPVTVDGQHPYTWPQSVIDDLKTTYFDAAADQIGTSEANDFILDEDLHLALRELLYEGIKAGKVTEVVPFNELDLHLKKESADPTLTQAKKDRLKLEAPLAVKSQEERSGFFPTNKFSSVPLVMTATRQAQIESNGDDVKKRLMVVPNCHVKRLITEGGRVTWIQTNSGDVQVPPNGVIIIAAATIESARLAKLSFGDLPNSDLMGSNLMAHLRSNITIRIPRTALAAFNPIINELQSSALFVKGRHTFADGSLGHFHLQITASGTDPLHPSTNSEQELFRKIPDIDGFDVFKNVTDDKIVITMRGIGEMHGQNLQSSVMLDPELDEYGVNRAYVNLANPNNPADVAGSPLTQRDLELWDALDNASDEVAQIFANGNNFEVLAPDNTWLPATPGSDLNTIRSHVSRRDGMGTTHHEAGTLWMGDDPTNSVTNSNAQIHHVENVFALGPCLFPSVGSPNPMLTGVALARRLGDFLNTTPTPYSAEATFTALYDGVNTSNWKKTGAGNFIFYDGQIEAVPGNDLGLLWCNTPMPDDYILKLEFMRTRSDDNSGVFIRFPDPESRADYYNKSYVAVDFGFEVQIDDRGYNSDTNQFNDPLRTTGAIYAMSPSSSLGSKPLGQWNELEIKVQGQSYTVTLNGTQVTSFNFVPGSDPQHPDRAVPSAGVSRFVGVQAHTGRVLYRKIRYKAI